MVYRLVEKITNLTFNKKIEVIGSILGVCGGVLIASNLDISRWAFVIFLVSTTMFIILGYRKGMLPFLLMQCFFLMIDFLGIYRWFF
jgi:nicotinamide riboside transporter PnuC